MKKSEKVISIPSIKWRCPPKVHLNPNWLVASGEQSLEVGLQRQRELKVSEAVYHRLTDIPHSPSGALCKDEYLPGDHISPIIRITPIEDVEAPTDSSSDLLTSSNRASQNQPVVSVFQPAGIPNTAQCVNAALKRHAGGTQGINSCGDADIAAAASAALTALLKSNEIGSSIDTDLLIDILNNPDSVSLLLNMPSSDSGKPSPKANLEQVLPSVPFSCPPSEVFLSTSASGKLGGPQKPLQLRYVTVPMPSAKGITSSPNSIRGPVMAPSVNQIKPVLDCAAATPLTSKVPFPPQVKDANYYRNLIKQHGLDNTDFEGKISQPHQSSHEGAYPDIGLTKDNQRVWKKSKPCVFFNTQRGCRRGVECPFQHDITLDRMRGSSQVSNAKRMKLGR
ncbi:unnamed protein product [Rhodiola kirilowii]